MNPPFRGVVLITIDSLRADHLGYMGYCRNTTPFIDKLSKKSKMFVNAVSSGPTTATTFPPMLSSTYLSRHPFARTRNMRLHRDRKLLTEYIGGEVKSAAFHSNPYISSYFGYQRGFDEFEDFFITDSTINPPFLRKLKRLGEIILGKPPFTPGEEINRRSLKWIEETQTSFFLWNHYMEPHMPYLPPKGYEKLLSLPSTNWLRKLILNKRLDSGEHNKIDDQGVSTLEILYDCCIRYTDDILRNLVSALPDDVAVILTSDHGEGFREHGYLGHSGHLYEEGIHIPLLIHPGKKREIKPVSHLDIAPTVHELLGLDIPNNYQGESLISSFERDAVISESPGLKDKWTTSLRYKDKKYILDDKRGCQEFYDLTEDPSERYNICADVDISQYKAIIQEHRRRQLLLKRKDERKKISVTLSDLKI